MVKLLYYTPLWLMARAIRQSHYNFHLSDTPQINSKAEYICPLCGDDLVASCDGYIACINPECDYEIYREEDFIGAKDFDLIKRVGFHMNHSRVLESSLITFNIKLSTKALLEESTHKVGLTQVTTSSRYALDIIDIEFEKTGDKKIDNFLENYRQSVIELIDSYRDEKGKIKKKDMDRLAMTLPQCFVYKTQLSFNLRSLVHFLELRTEKAAHETIRKMSFEIIEALPQQYRELVFENKKIKENYQKHLEGRL